MKPYKKSEKVKTTVHRKVYNVYSRGWDYPYFEWYDFNLYPYTRPGSKRPNKRIHYSKVSEYRTWKYNRKTQWK